MSLNKRPQSAIRHVIALSTGLTLSVGAMLAPAVSFAAPPTQVAAAPKKRSVGKWIAAGVATTALLGAGGVGYKVVGSMNDMATTKVTTLRVLSDVGVAEQSRADLIPNLLKVAKTTAKFEESTYTKMADSLGQAALAVKNAQKYGPEAQVQASVQMTTALQPIMMLQTQYPELKSVKQFEDVMVQLKRAESEVGTARLRYNRAAETYNAKLVTFPSRYVAKIDGHTQLPFFEADAGSKKAPVLE